jgi:hypothetical protein
MNDMLKRMISGLTRQELISLQMLIKDMLGTQTDPSDNPSEPKIKPKINPPKIKPKINPPKIKPKIKPKR